jgi:mono/diheme cytochrome c family protein
LDSQFRSNGEQVYTTATSQRGTIINSDIGMGMMGNGLAACANCHGRDGGGGTVQMMMHTIDVPDIRYETLTSAEISHEGEGHPPNTDETIKRAITQGIDPAGNLLDWPMLHPTCSKERWECEEPSVQLWHAVPRLLP